MTPVYVGETIEVYVRKIGEAYEIAIVDLPRGSYPPFRLPLTLDNYFRLLCGRGCDAGFARVQVVRGTLVIALEIGDPFEDDARPVCRVPWEPIARAIKAMMQAQR